MADDETRTTDNLKPWKPRSLQHVGGLAAPATQKIVRRLQTAADRTMVGTGNSPLRRSSAKSAALRQRVEHSHDLARRVRMRHKGRSAEQQRPTGQADLTLAQSALDAAPSQENIMRGPSIFASGQAIPPVGGTLPHAEPPVASPPSTPSSTQGAMGPGTIILPMSKNPQGSKRQAAQHRPVHRPGSRVFSRVQEGAAGSEAASSVSRASRETSAPPPQVSVKDDAPAKPKTATPQTPSEPVADTTSQPDVAQRKVDASVQRRVEQHEASPVRPAPTEAADTELSSTAKPMPAPMPRDASTTSAQEEHQSRETAALAARDSVPDRRAVPASETTPAPARPTQTASQSVTSPPASPVSQEPIQRKEESSRISGTPAEPFSEMPETLPLHTPRQSSETTQSRVSAEIPAETEPKRAEDSATSQPARIVPEAPTNAPKRLRQLITDSKTAAERSVALDKPAALSEPSAIEPTDMPIVQAKRSRADERSAAHEAALTPSPAVEPVSSRSAQPTLTKESETPVSDRQERSTTSRVEAPASIPVPDKAPNAAAETVIQRKAAPAKHDAPEQQPAVESSRISDRTPSEEPTKADRRTATPAKDAVSALSADYRAEPADKAPADVPSVAGDKDMPLRQTRPDVSHPDASQPESAGTGTPISRIETQRTPSASDAAAKSPTVDLPIQRKPAKEIPMQSASDSAGTGEMTQPVIPAPKPAGTGPSMADAPIQRKVSEDSTAQSGIDAAQPGKAIRPAVPTTPDSEKAPIEADSSEMPLAIQRKATTEDSTQAAPKSTPEQAPTESAVEPKSAASQVGEELLLPPKKKTPPLVEKQPPSESVSSIRPALPLVHKPSSRQRWLPQTAPEPVGSTEQQPVQRKEATPSVESASAPDRIEAAKSAAEVPGIPKVNKPGTGETPTTAQSTSASTTPSDRALASQPPLTRASEHPESEKSVADSARQEQPKEKVARPGGQEVEAAAAVPFVPRTSRRAREQAHKISAMVTPANIKETPDRESFSPTEELVQRITGRHKSISQDTGSEKPGLGGRTASTNRLRSRKSAARPGRTAEPMPLVRLPKLNKEDQERSEPKSGSVTHRLPAHAAQQVIQRKAAAVSVADAVEEEIDYADLARRVYPHLKRMLVIEKERRPGGR